MPAGNPLGYLSPEMQGQLLGVAGLAPAGAQTLSASDALLSQLADVTPSAQSLFGNPVMDQLNAAATRFEPNEMDLLDVRQGMRTPAWLAEKYGVTGEQVIEAFPEFRHQFQGSTPQAQEQRRQPGQISAAQAAANERSREEQMRRIQAAKQRQAGR